MDELLFLAHRIPYPPDKGDKIRSWHFLRHLAQRYRVHLGCFVDDPRDWQFTDLLRGVCADCHFIGLDARTARLKSLVGLLDGRPMTLPYYFDRSLQQWAGRVLSSPAVSRVFVYCSAMAQYIPADIRASRLCVADLVDLDSQKWLDYARASAPPASWAWRREGLRLRAVEKQISETFGATLVSTLPELELLHAVGCKERAVCLPNGVDADYFSPERNYEAPPAMRGTAAVFTGAMDYRPNIDAVLHFARAIWPRLRAELPDIHFYVVGSNPRPEISALSSVEGIVVTGRVPDVRPYLAHATLIVAPLRIARGIQNKVLEGMAMAKPVVASPEALAGIHVVPDSEAFIADNADAFVAAACRIARTGIGDAIGRNARRRVLSDHQWSASCARLDGILTARNQHLAA